MAPNVPVTLAAARTRAIEGNVESQDSQAVMIAMHRLHGIGVRSSSPIDPLEYDQDLIQQWMQHPRPPKVHQQYLGNAHHVANASLAAEKPESEAIKTNSRAKVHHQHSPSLISKGKNKNPAGAATAGNRGSSSSSQAADRRLDSSPAAVTAATTTTPTPAPAPAPVPAPNLIPSSQEARSTNASNHRVSSSHNHSTSSPRSQPGVQSAHPIDQTKPPRHVSIHPNETIPSSLRVNALVGSQIGNPGNDADNSQDLVPASHRSVRPVVKTYSKRRRGKKMDSSPQSPTQSNNGRSYEQYLPRGDDLISSDPVRQPRLSHSARRSSPSPRNTNTTVQDDDTGQVEFDYSALARADTQLSNPDSTRTRPTPQQPQAASDHVFGNPETPAAPRNPFLGSKSTAVMASSQMFKQTQYSSAFKATFSPTSSRPSPDNLHLNSISPNPSPLKRVTTGPSPLQGASSLPQLPLVYDTSPQQTDEDEPPVDENDDQIARSHISRSSHFPAHLPIEEYRPVQRWDIRAASAQSGSDIEDDEGEDMSDEDERRRRRAARLRAKAQKRLKAIPFERQSDEAIVPATNQEEVSPAARQYLRQCEGVSRRHSQMSIEDFQDAAPDVTDSQNDLVQLSASLPGQPSAGGNSSSNDVVPNTDPDPTSAPVQTDEELAVQVPETSPARLQPRPIGDMMPPSSDEASTPGSFSKPLTNSLAATSAEAPMRSVSQSQQQRNRNAVDNRREDSGIDANNNAGGSCVVISSSPPAPAFSTRARLRGGKPPATAPPTTSSTSPLSRLTTTPVMSNKTTPLTEESPRDGLTLSSTSTGDADSSPAVAKAHRQNSKHVSKPAPTKLRASTRRTTRQSFPSHVSVSTDELAGSPRPSTPTFQQTTHLSRLGRTSLRDSPASRNDSRGRAKVFTGMAFAISFQGKRPGEKDAQYKARMTTSAAITIKIKQAGGKVLPDGFNHLFEFVPVKNADREASSDSSTPQPDDDIVLAPQARDTGFTALIADGHSRKVKYMQALALGLPCIHERWITACIDKQHLVDWADYLLCAGNSSFLGDAIRSRNLSPYDAATARLAEVIQYRPRLLDQSRILLLMTRADETRKEAYVFLARVLGASLSRVYTVEEAKRQLKAREDAGKAFDWIYVVDEKVNVEEMFMQPAAGIVEGSRKRKRRSDAGKEDVSMAPPAKKVRALSDELVIQSLILGRLMEDGEMKATG